METVKQELENLKKEMEMLKAAVSHLTDGHSATGAKTPPSAPVREPHPDPTLNRIMETLNRTIEQENRTGSITYLGVFASAGRRRHGRSDSALHRESGQAYAAACAYAQADERRRNGGKLRLPYNRAGVPSSAAAVSGRSGV